MKKSTKIFSFCFYILFIYLTFTSLLTQIYITSPNSNTSNIPDGIPPIEGKDAGHYFITSNWMIQNIIVDGNITSASEWADATTLNLLEPNYLINATIYFKNNATHLAILCDVFGDETENNASNENDLNNLDHFDLGFDTNNDQIRSDGAEDSFSLLANGTLFRWNYSTLANTYELIPLEGAIGANTFGSSLNHANFHEIYEIFIPLNILLTSQGQTIGIGSEFNSTISSQGWSYDNASNQINSYPSTIQDIDMSTWGKLKLALEPSSSVKLDKGNQESILLFYTNSSGSIINSSDALDFTIPVPTDQWGMSFTNLTFTDLTAPNIYQHLGNDNDDSDQSVSTGWVYMGFNITNYCTLKNFSVKIKDTNTIGNQHLWRVYDASWDSVDQRPEPGSQVSGAQGNFYTENPFAYWEWNDTTSVNVVLDPSNTDNNTFFVAMLDIDFQSTSWRYRFDAIGSGGDGEDEGLAFVGTTFQPWDFELKINLEPISSTPTPTQVSMQVNGSAVNPNGNWNSTTRYTSTTGSVLMNVTAAWPLAYNVSYNCEYDKTVSADTRYLINAGQNPIWIVNWSIQFPPNANNYQMNVSLPIDWSVSEVRNGTFPGLPYNQWINITSGGQKIVLIKNIIDVTLQDWVINCSAPNYVTDIDLFQEIGSYELLGPNPTVNITDVIHINGTISGPIEGAITDNINGANLTIYLPGVRTCYSEGNIFPSNGLANFTDWLISDNTNEPGTYVLQVLWGNGTEVGMNEVPLNIIYPTNINIFIEQQKREDFPPVLDWFIGTDNLINITVFYNNTFSDKLGGISTINASYRILNDTDLIQPWSSLGKEVLGTGYYNVTLNLATWANGTYYVGINLNKTGCQLQELNITLNVVINTSLFLVEPISAEITPYFPENLTIQVNYTRINGQEITFANVICQVDSGSPVSLKLDGVLYRIQLNSTDYGVGYHNVTIAASTSGYKSRTLYINWTIQTCVTDYILYVNGSYSTNEFYYGEQMKITIYFNDTVHNVPIVNALINLTVLGYDPITLSDGGNGNYSRVLNSSSRSAGLWNISILIQNLYYMNHSTDIELYVRYNTTLEWMTTPPSKIRPGDSFTVAVKLSRNPPLPGQNITFNRTSDLGIEYFYRITNASGIAEFTFDITSAMGRNIEIHVSYNGNLTDFSSDLGSQTISISTGGIFEQYWGVFVFGIVLAVLGVASVRLRQKQKRAKELRKQQILTSFQDVTKILHLVVIHKGTGTDIFDYKIQERLDPTLLAGFIQAVKEFGKELSKEEP
ncbi:MAG: hypothetical protein ACFFD2_07130 [Promethearchaeota archaeon]